MAKGNMLLGYSRGSVGDVTFYRSGGSQRARARNRQPNNPRTRSQQTQRAIFSNAVKFYKLCVTNFFKFAYENKKPNESDYNAYMRENVARSCMMSRTAYYCEPYPALGNWLVTRGSLQTINNVESDNTKTPKFSFGVSTSASFTENTTIAEISNILLQSSEYQVGDIVTILEVDTIANEAIPTATPDKTKYIAGAIVLQFLVDPNNQKAWSTVYSATPVKWSWKAQGGNLALFYGATEEIGDELWISGLHQFAVIHSRNTSEGLKVSTQEIVMNPRAITALETALSDETYKSAVLADWAATPNAILQGEGLTLTTPSMLENITSLQIYSNTQTVYEDTTTHAVGNTYSVEFGAFNEIVIKLDATNPDNMAISGFTAEGVTIEDSNLLKLSDTSIQVDLILTNVATAPTDPILIKYNGETIAKINFQ